jgi:hypothetical protein
VKLSNNTWYRGLLLSGIYAIGVLGILATGGGSSGGGNSSNFTCALSVQGIAPVSDGTVWAGAFAKTNLDTEDRVVLFGSDGSEQLSYVIGTGGSDNAVRAVALATDGSTDIYVGGDFSGGILRLDANGTLDAAFNVGTGFDGRVTSIVPLTNGQVYVGGLFTEFNGNFVSGLVRLNSDGSRDGLGFSAVGVTNVESVALATDAPFTGSVYSGGSGLNPAARWSSTGLRDGTFNPVLNPVFNVIPAADATGDVYFGGGFTNRIIRVNDNGTTDLGFNVGAGFDDDVVSIDRGAGGDIYVGGSFSTYQAASANGIVRLDSTGDRDAGFVIDSGFSDPNGILPSSKVASVAEATDGSTDVLVGGGFTQYKGVAANGIVRLDNDGSIDNAFDVNINIDGDTCDSQTIPDS